MLPLYWAGTSIGHELAYGDDVGMSGGGFGCVGGWMQRLPRRWKTTILSITVAYLGIRLVLFTELFADLVHILAFVGGYWYDKTSGNRHGKNVESGRV